MSNRYPTAFQRQKCAGTTKAGNPCKAWAVRGERYCSAHLGRNVGAGAPAGNTNATKHGFYASAFTVQELVDVMELGGEINLDDEIAMIRVASRRVMRWLSDEIEEEGPPSAVTLHRLLTALNSSARTVARLVREKAHNTGQGELFDDVLDELAEELGIEL